jgi:hypothetical protein
LTGKLVTGPVGSCEFTEPWRDVIFSYVGQCIVTSGLELIQIRLLVRSLGGIDSSVWINSVKGWNVDGDVTVRE